MFVATRAMNVMTARLTRPTRRTHDITYERKERIAQEQGRCE
jgi:hypothetical protein